MFENAVKMQYKWRIGRNWNGGRLCFAIKGKIMFCPEPKSKISKAASLGVTTHYIYDCCEKVKEEVLEFHRITNV